MASLPPANSAAPSALPSLSPAHLLTLGMFVFGMDTVPYQSLTRSIEWRHGDRERHLARPASQFLGPGQDSISIFGTIVPELGGSYSSIETLEEMADTGDDFPLVDGLGRVLGNFRIVRMDLDQRTIMAGGIPRQQGFSLEVQRVD